MPTIKKNGKRKQKITSRKNFPRIKRLPERVQLASELWLSIFTQIIDTLLATRDLDDHFSEMDQKILIDTAESMTNRALDAYQTRWPNAEIPAE